MKLQTISKKSNSSFLKNIFDPKNRNKLIAGLGSAVAIALPSLAGLGVAIYNEVWWDKTVYNFLGELSHRAGKENKEGIPVSKAFRKDQIKAAKKLLKGLWKSGDPKIKKDIEDIHKGIFNNGEYTKDGTIFSDNITHNIFFSVLYNNGYSIFDFMKKLLKNNDPKIIFLLFDFFKSLWGNLKNWVTFDEKRNNENDSLGTIIKDWSNLYKNLSEQFPIVWDWLKTLFKELKNKSRQGEIQNFVSLISTSIFNLFIDVYKEENKQRNEKPEDWTRGVINDYSKKEKRHKWSIEALPWIFYNNLEMNTTLDK